MQSSGSLDELLPIFCQPHYFIMLTLNLVICIGINTGLDIWALQSQGPKYYIVSGGTIANMLLFSFVVSFFTFWNSGNQHKRIKAGEAPPVTRRALCDNCFKKVICFSMQEPSWKKRIFLFMWNCFLFPGVFLVIIVTVLCMLATGFDSLGQSDSCEVSAAVSVVVIECWKTVGMTIIFTMMYAASHNEEQAEIADVVNPMLAAPMSGASNVGGASALGANSADDLYNNP